MKSFGLDRLKLAVTGVLLAAAQPAFSQDATVLEEVVVTAEKRTSTVQETPISISAFSGADLVNAGVNDSYGLSNLTPGLTIQEEVIGKVVIRGVGTENYTVGSDPGVAIHKDGGYIARSSVAVFDFYDINRIEVLRGPQGTLYGRNASGGVINILSNEPTDQFEGYVKVDVGDYNKRRVEGALNLPMSETASARLSVLYAERDGYSKNVFAGSPALAPDPVTGFPGSPAIPSAKERGLDELDTQDLTSVRAQFKASLADNLELLVQGEWSRDDSLPPGWKYFDEPPYWFDAFTNGQLTFDAANAIDQNIRDLRTVSQGFETNIPGTDRTVPSISRSDQDSYLARLTWDLGSMTFTSLSTYRKIDFSWINDGDGFDTFFVTYFQTDASKQFTQEFQLASAGDGNLEWILGAYYLDEDAETFTGIPFVWNIFGPAPYILWDGVSNTEALGLFGQATYAVSDKLKVTAGLRYNKDEKQGDLVYNLFGFVLPPPSGDSWKDSLNDSWDAVTPKLALDYQFTDDVLGYVSATRGFKSGGFNLIGAQGPYDPEELWSYEAGLKTRLADGRVIANIGAFYYDYKDMQVGKVVNTSVVVANAAAATITGAEIELRALLGSGFEVNAGVALLDTKYDEFITEDPAWPGDAGCGTLVAAPRTISLKGCELPRAPEFQGSLGISWTRALGNGGELYVRGDYAYRGDQYFTQFNRDIVGQDAYGLLGARVTYTAPDERWYVTAWGDNLSDKDYFVTVLESGVAPAGTVVPQAVIGAPRTYGLSIGFNF